MTNELTRGSIVGLDLTELKEKAEKVRSKWTQCPYANSPHL